MAESDWSLRRRGEAQLIGDENLELPYLRNLSSEMSHPPEFELFEPLEVRCKKEADGSYGSVECMVFGIREGTGKSGRILGVPPAKASSFRLMRACWVNHLLAGRGSTCYAPSNAETFTQHA